jgi:hypothetical protein
MERLGKHVIVATDAHATIEELLETVFSTRSMLSYNRDGLERIQCSVESRSVKRRLGGSCEIDASLRTSRLKVS